MRLTCILDWNRQLTSWMPIVKDWNKNSKPSKKEQTEARNQIMHLSFMKSNNIEF